jgi:hypothetical protein
MTCRKMTMKGTKRARLHHDDGVISQIGDLANQIKEKKRSNWLAWTMRIYVDLDGIRT